MLNSHPGIAIPLETKFVLEAWERRRRFGDLRELENRRRLAHWIFKRNKTRHSRLQVDPDEAIERLLGAPPTLGSMLAMCFLFYAETQCKARWGDKRPTYAAKMRAVWDLFPNAQFINVVRDPRACAASLRKLGWYGGQVAPAIELWERSLNTVERWRPKLAPDQLLEAKYEDLVCFPEASLERVTAFSGLSGDEDAMAKMLRYYEPGEHRNERYHANVSRPPDPTRISDWKKVLSQEEVAFIEKATGPLMRRHGYEPVAEGTAAPAELLRKLGELRKARAARNRRAFVKDRVEKLVIYRRPLAAEPSLAVGTIAAARRAAPVSGNAQ